MHDAPLLFGIGDESCGTSQKGAISWVSVDEGDVVEQIRISDGRMPKFRPPFKPGETLDYENNTYTVTEVEQAECIALRRRFDEELQVGETYDFVNATGEDNGLLSGEFWGAGSMWFQGR